MTARSFLGWGEYVPLTPLLGVSQRLTWLLIVVHTNEILTSRQHFVYMTQLFPDQPEDPGASSVMALSTAKHGAVLFEPA